MRFSSRLCKRGFTNILSWELTQCSELAATWQTGQSYRPAAAGRWKDPGSDTVINIMPCLTMLAILLCAINYVNKISVYFFTVHWGFWFVFYISRERTLRFFVWCFWLACSCSMSPAEVVSTLRLKWQKWQVEADCSDIFWVFDLHIKSRADDATLVQAACEVLHNFPACPM